MNSNIFELKKGCVVSTLLFLAACSDEPQPASIEPLSLNDAYLYVTFSDGPNQGRHKYLVDGDNAGAISLIHSEGNNVSFFEARNLVSEDGSRMISSLRRFTAGEIEKGENLATNWMPTSSTSMDCGRLEQRDENDDYAYRIVFGTFLDCDSTLVTKVSEWRELRLNSDSGSGAKRERLVEGKFKDRVAMQMAMDNEPVKSMKVTMEVEFGVVEQAD